MPPILLYPAHAGRVFKITMPKWHGFYPPADGSIRQDSEKANWNIFLVPSIQVSQLFQAGWRFWEQQIYPALRHWGYYFLMGSWKHGVGCQYGLYIEQCQHQRKWKGELSFSWTIWNEHVKELWWKNPFLVLLPWDTQSQCNHADFNPLVSWCYLDPFTWKI